MGETCHEYCKVEFTSNNSEKLKKIIDYWNEINNNTPVSTQSTLKNNNNKDPPHKKYFCNNPDCKKEITKKEVAYCLFKDENGQQRFGGKVYCLDCQEVQ